MTSKFLESFSCRFEVLKHPRSSHDLATQLLDGFGCNIKDQTIQDSLSSAPVRMCLSCSLTEGDIHPCARTHLEERPQIYPKADEAGLKKSAGLKSSNKARAKRVAKYMVYGHQGSDEKLFMHRLSNEKDSKHMDANKAGRHMRLLAAMLKLEPTLDRMVDIGRRIPYSDAVVAPYSLLSTSANAIRASATPAGHYHRGLKFGPLVFESGVKR